MKFFYALALAVGSVFLQGCAEEEVLPTTDPKSLLRSDIRGYKISPGVAVGPNHEFHWIQSAVKGYKPTSFKDVPATLNIVPTMISCDFREPAAGEKIANVYVGRGQVGSAVFAASNETIAKRTEDWIEQYKSRGSRVTSRASVRSDSLRLVDLIVTDTSAPLYLILQSETGNTLWNMHVAPGVKFAHIAVLGRGAVGIANIDESIPVEFMNDEAATECGITPVRKPADHWLFVQRAKADKGSVYTDAMKKNLEMHREYTKWFKRSFGIQSETSVIGLNEASHFIVGPLPSTLDERVPYKGLKDAHVKIASEPFIIATNEANYVKEHDAIVNGHVMRMVGGDLTSLSSGS